MLTLAQIKQAWQQAGTATNTNLYAGSPEPLYAAVRNDSNRPLKVALKLMLADAPQCEMETNPIAAAWLREAR